MKVTAWNNGAHNISGAGYGLKVAINDRDANFKKEWSTVSLSLPGKAESVEINISKESFWGSTCRELISKEIGLWLLSNGFAPWAKGNPPKFELVCIASNSFAINSTNA